MKLSELEGIARRRMKSGETGDVFLILTQAEVDELGVEYVLSKAEYSPLPDCITYLFCGVVFRIKVI